MRLRHFVSGSSVILIGWLVVTFVHPVSARRYPKLDKYPATAMRMPTAQESAAKQESAEFSVSVSR